jgi:hypothetical protein
MSAAPRPRPRSAAAVPAGARRPLTSALLPSALVVALSLAAVGCKASAPADPCAQAVTEKECLLCCERAGRSGATWVDDDCVCHDK